MAKCCVCGEDCFWTANHVNGNWYCRKCVKIMIKRVSVPMSKWTPEGVRGIVQPQETLDTEYKTAVASQQASEPWTVRYLTDPCPYCGHYKVRYAKWEDKQMSVAFWGAMLSDKIDKNFKCDHCKRIF